MYKLNTAEIAHALQDHPDKPFVEQLLIDLTQGARIGYTGPRVGRDAPNLPSAEAHKEALTADIAKDITEGVTAGPFTPDNHPYPYARASPIGCIAKQKPGPTPDTFTTKIRRIHHLSWPTHGNTSINHNIPDDFVSVKYIKLRDVLDRVSALGKGTTMSIADITAAFRHVPVHPEDTPLLCFTWDKG